MADKLAEKLKEDIFRFAKSMDVGIEVICESLASKTVVKWLVDGQVEVSHMKGLSLAAQSELLDLALLYFSDPAIVLKEITDKETLIREFKTRILLNVR